MLDLVDDDRDAVVLEDVVVGLRRVERQRVLEARAAAALDGDAQRLVVASAAATRSRIFSAAVSVSVTAASGVSMASHSKG